MNDEFIIPPDAVTVNGEVPSEAVVDSLR
jgi:hypothetical protein